MYDAGAIQAPIYLTEGKSIKAHYKSPKYNYMVQIYPGGKLQLTTIIPVTSLCQAPTVRRWFGKSSLRLADSLITRGSETYMVMIMVIARFYAIEDILFQDPPVAVLAVVHIH